MENCIGIGKIVLDSLNTEKYNIPHLHFLLIKNENKLIEAINLEFGLASVGNKPEIAVQILTSMIVEYIEQAVEKFGFNFLIETVSNDRLSEYWTAYRRFEFILASHKNDISHGFVSYLRKKFLEEITNTYGIKPRVKYTIRETAA